MCLLKNKTRRQEMGANSSTDAAEFRAKYGNHYSPGKPGIPEGIPKVTDITHNSVILSWLSPVNSGRILAYQIECVNIKDRKWRIITSTCQGTTYHVRNLSPETVYMFRVRAENINGVSKPSHPSDEVRTRPIPTNYLEEKRTTKLVRRHSHYLKLDSGLNNLMHKADVDVVDTSENDVGSIPFRRNSMRGSLPAGFRTKRNSVTSFLPGSKRESVCNFKESKKSFEESSIAEEDGINLKRISTSSTEASSIFSSNSMTSIVEDEELKILYGQTDYHMCSDNDDAYSTTNSHVTTSSGCSSMSCKSSQSSHSHQSTHNALVHPPPLPSNENTNILTASISDDNKMDYISHPDKKFHKLSYHAHRSDVKANPNAGKTIFDICDNEIWKGRIDNSDEKSSPNNNHNMNLASRNTLDLRSIRNMLNSQDIMVKTLDSCNLENSRRTHCAIKELDEDLAIDIVSTL
ncbi:hypothetical protein ACF0H5_023365 [Mactra antiquata]